VVVVDTSWQGLSSYRLLVRSVVWLKICEGLMSAFFRTILAIWPCAGLWGDSSGVWYGGMTTLRLEGRTGDIERVFIASADALSCTGELVVHRNSLFGWCPS
jgi:hypothetical protein